MSIRKANVRSKRFTLIDGNVPFQVSESFKTLRANLIFALSTQKSKIIAVSSALPSEGKSTVAANLALTLTQTDAKVLFIDTDLRKPVQHKVFKLKNKLGLSTLLGGLHSFKEVLNSQVVPGLDIVTSGPIPPNPSEMLASENMKVLLEELSKFYDYIILDTAPVTVVSDTLSMVNYIAGVVLVALQGGTPREAYEKAISSIEFADGHVLGAVINNVASSEKKYRYKSYKRGVWVRFTRLRRNSAVFQDSRKIEFNKKLLHIIQCVEAVRIKNGFVCWFLRRFCFINHHREENIMLVTLQSGKLQISADSFGAELHSVKYNGCEYLWQCKSAWKRYAPVLFPFICSPANKKYIAGGKEFTIPSNHGFARDSRFTLLNADEYSVSFALESSEETKKGISL